MSSQRIMFKEVRGIRGFEDKGCKECLEDGYPKSDY